MRHVRDGGMVQENAHFAVVAALVTEGVLNFGLAFRRRAGEIVVAHRESDVLLDDDFVVVVHALRPALAAVDREAAILRVAVCHVLTADEVRPYVRLERRVGMYVRACVCMCMCYKSEDGGQGQ